jgi:pyridinium-3,5-bisthiocarboxylic acid mononucleotide nickel chelatase
VPIAYLDPFSGASGDMTLGALIDAGAPVERLREELEKLPLDGYELHVTKTEQHGITGTRIVVQQTTSDVPHRHWRDIRTMIAGSAIPNRARARAITIFQGLAEAEARVHGMSPDEVHFHEVGAVDSIVDIVGVTIALDLLDIDALYSGTLRDGTGFIRAAHGVLPVPVPATAELIAMAEAPLQTHDIEAELLTPTGAAILTRLARFERPAFTPSAVGYGFGQRELPWPNALRIWIGELNDQPETSSSTAAAPSTGPVEILLETNIDDMNPEFYEPLFDRLFDAGAFDVYVTPITMKRGRPATKLSIIAEVDHRAAIEAVLMEHSTTLGIRMMPIERTKAGRKIESVTTRWGEVRIKLKIWNGRVIDAAPEYIDCYRIAQEHEIAIRLVYGEAIRLAEPFIGRRTGDEHEWRGWKL